MIVPTDGVPHAANWIAILILSHDTERYNKEFRVKAMIEYEINHFKC